MAASRQNQRSIGWLFSEDGTDGPDFVERQTSRTQESLMSLTRIMEKQGLDPFMLVRARGAGGLAVGLEEHARFGHGLVFKRDLKEGEDVFSEVPLVIDNAFAIARPLHRVRHNERHNWSIVEECLKTMSIARIKLLLAANYAEGLADVTWETPGDDTAKQYMVDTYKVEDALVYRLYNIFSTNNLVAGIGLMPIRTASGAPLQVPFPRYGFFLLMSRANHACAPSATLRRERPAGALATTVVTTRNVRAGEPLTIDYLQTVSGPSKRVELCKAFGFRCACDRCRPLCSLLACDKIATQACPCQHAQYCCKDHQRHDWQRHKLEEHEKDTFFV